MTETTPLGIPAEIGLTVRVAPVSQPRTNPTDSTLALSPEFEAMLATLAANDQLKALNKEIKAQEREARKAAKIAAKERSRFTRNCEKWLVEACDLIRKRFDGDTTDAVREVWALSAARRGMKLAL